MDAYICLFNIRGLPQPQRKTDRINTHDGVYRYTVKCASEDITSPRSTLRRVYATPRGVTLAFVFVLCSIVVVSNVQKQSVSNAF